MIWYGTGAALAFAGAIVLLAAFFVTRNERYDRLAEVLFVAFGVLQLPVIVAVGADNSAPLASVSMALGLVGAAGVGIGELLSLLRLVDFRRVAGLVTLAFMAFLAWIGLTSLELLGSRAELAWLGIASIAAGALIVGWMAATPGVLTGKREPHRAHMFAFLVPMVGITVWLLWLATVL